MTENNNSEKKRLVDYNNLKRHKLLNWIMKGKYIIYNMKFTLIFMLKAIQY